MAGADVKLDTTRAVERLMRLLAIEGVTGREKAIASEVAKTLIAEGVPARSIRHDKANDSIPLPTETGNLLVDLPGTIAGNRLLFMTHLDTVPLCAGAVPRLVGKRIKPEGPTALGGDNRTGVGVLTTLAATLMKNKIPHPPITLLFTVREESGLFGARHLNPRDLGDVSFGFNVDGRLPNDLTIAAVGAERWEVEIHGRASHAGVHPEKGISASLVASLALAEIHQKGWFGKIKKPQGEGTSNVGSIGGKGNSSAGEASNVVTDYTLVKGEARSHDSKFVKTIVKAYKDAFTAASQQVINDKGKKARVKFSSRMDYYPFRIKESAPVVLRAQEAVRAIGLEPNLKTGNGGLDANWMIRHGIPTVTFGAGQYNIHTVEEYVDIDDYLTGCRMALALATLP